MRNPLNRMLKERKVYMCPNIDVGSFDEIGKRNSTYQNTGFGEGMEQGNWMHRLGIGRDFMSDLMPGSDSEKADDEGVSALKNVTTGASGSGNKSAKFKTADRKGVTKKSLVVKKPTAKGYS